MAVNHRSLLLVDERHSGQTGHGTAEVTKAYGEITIRTDQEVFARWKK